MKKNLILRITALLQAFALLLSGCGGKVPAQNGESEAYICYDYTPQLCTCWNPHTFETSIDAYPQSFIQSSLYNFIFNDELHPVEGKEPYEHYSIVPEMAAEEPVDITESLKAERPEFNIPSGASEGYAFSVKLRDDLCWDDGTPIDAHTFEESFRRLLDPKLVNFRVSDFTSGSNAIAGAQAYSGGNVSDYSGVGLYAAGDLEVVYVFISSQSGFSLYTSLSNSFLVKPDLYDSCLKETTTASGSVWSSTYCTGLSNSPSYGPYRISSFQTDKSIQFVRNDKWFGYKDGSHRYVDPVSHETLDMYQTTGIDCQVVAEDATAKRMFFAGELTNYSLSSDDFSEYSNSEFCHPVPGAGVRFLILNGYEDVIKTREQSPDFDRSVRDIETQLLDSFKKAVSLSIDREYFVNTLYPGSYGGYGLISDSYVYDTETLEKYRNTEEAMETLCDFYSVDPSLYPDLVSAVESITGYDQKAATDYYRQAFTEAKERGYITDNDNDGISDQTVTLLYTLQAENDDVNRTVEYLNEILSRAAVGSGFENRIRIEKSAPLGNGWVNQFSNGLTDMAFMSWTGSIMDPFSMVVVYTHPEYAVNKNWFDPSNEYMELDINGENIRLSLLEWTDALNGEEVVSNGGSFNFGRGQADVDVRLRILAGIEKAVLDSNNYIPVMCTNSMSLLSQQAYYPVDEYNAVMSYGGLAYLRYNYDDEEWKAHVKELGGTLKY